MTMWLYRRLMKMPWTEKRTNENILNELGKKLTLKSKIRKQQANFLGHATRRQGLENPTTTAQVLGKGSQGRPREKILGGVRNGQEKNEQWFLSQRRMTERWRNMVSSVF